MMRDTPKQNTIRFWDRFNGSPVKLELSLGLAIVYNRFNRDQEGHSRELFRYEYRGDLVSCELYGEGSDCDGYHQWGGTMVWDCKTLVDVDGVSMPYWIPQDEYRRDLTAEENNY
jgi:hypothetical protein